MRRVKPAAEAPAVRVPLDARNEQVILCTALSEPKVRSGLIERLRSDSFAIEEHGKIWEVVVRMAKDDVEYSLDAVRTMLGDEKIATYVGQLMEGFAGPPANLRHHLDLLSWDRARIEIARGPLPALLAAFQDSTCPPEKLRALSKQLQESLHAGGGYRHYFRDPQRLLNEATEDVQKKAEGLARHPYGIEGLDDQENGEPRLVLGTSPGMITVITGVSGGAKSTLAMQIASCQDGFGKKVLYGAWEMKPKITLQLMACITLGLDRTALMHGKFTADEMRLHADEMARLSSFIRFVEQPTGKIRGERRSNDDILDDVHGMIADSGCDIAVFDLWKMAFRFRFEHEESEALYRQQAIAQATGAHCILVHQQKLKEVEARVDKRPSRETVKGSSAWIDVADTILGTNLPALWKNVPDETMEILALKQRIGKWPLAVEGDYHAPSGRVTNCRTIAYQRIVGGNDSSNELDRYFQDEEERPRRRRKKDADG